MPSYVEIPNENILDYHNFFVNASTGSEFFAFDDDVICADGTLSCYRTINLGKLDKNVDSFVISFESVNGSTTATYFRLRSESLNEGGVVCDITDDYQVNVVLDSYNCLGIIFPKDTEFNNFKFRVWANEGTEPKPYQKYGEVCYQEVADSVPEMPETGSGLKIDISTSEIFRYSNMITNGLMPVTYVLAGFALGFAIIYSLKNVFGRVGL